MSAQKTIVWHCLHNESEEGRIDRLNKELHRIFFDGKVVCPAKSLLEDNDGCVICGLCHEHSHSHLYHSTPRFLESLDAMQLIVESGKFAEVREEFFHWLASEGKPAYECTILLYRHNSIDIFRYVQRGHSRQEAFFMAALASQNYTVIKEENNEIL